MSDFWKKPGYLIVSEESLKTLQEVVNEHLQKGWKVNGPPFKDGVWRQSLIR